LELIVVLLVVFALAVGADAFGDAGGEFAFGVVVVARAVECQSLTTSTVPGSRPRRSRVSASRNARRSPRMVLNVIE
jgi:hypothetical protein